MKGVLRGDAVVKAGSLERIRFVRGLYAYVRSAQNGLEKRTGRHLSRDKKPFWHIDYLLKSDKAGIAKILYKKAKKEECRIAGFLGRGEFPIPRFECSDCSRSSHLFRISGMESIKGMSMEKIAFKVA